MQDFRGIQRIWRKASRRKYISRLMRAMRKRDRLIREVSEREGIDFTAFPFAFAVENYLTRRERQRLHHLNCVIRREQERRC